MSRKIAQIAAVMLFSANVAVVWAAVPEIVIYSIPPLGQNGYAEGKVVWNELTAGNAGRYAVIATLHAIWPGGGGYYAKPYENDYLNAIDADGNFSIRITTGGIDAETDEVIFYFVERSTNISYPEASNPTAMTGKYLATTTIFRRNWVSNPLQSSIRPGFVPAGERITLSCSDGGVIRYTLDGRNPITSSTAQTYRNNVFTVPQEGVLLVKATVERAGSYSPVFSLVWLPEEPLRTPFWGLNVSLALNGEPFGFSLTEAATRERLLPVVPLTKWIRTFGTVNNGQEYINKIAKSLGLHTMIGLYITNNEANNNAQIAGLRQILQAGPAPDLIAVGNETSLQNVSPATLASCIDAVRETVLERGLVIPVGSVDVAGVSWRQSIAEKLDFIGFNTYNGTWDNARENQMLSALKQTFVNQVSASPLKLVLVTETGTPYNGGRYSVPNGTQTPSTGKAANYLCGFLEWIRQDKIPAFYFEAYDEPVKSMNGGHPIEQYFGIMDGNGKIHTFYCDCIRRYGNGNITCTTATPPVHSDGNTAILYPNPTTDKVFLETESDVTVYNLQGELLQKTFGKQVDLSTYPQGTYLLQVNNRVIKVQKR